MQDIIEIASRHSLRSHEQKKASAKHHIAHERDRKALHDVERTMEVSGG